MSHPEQSGADLLLHRPGVWVLDALDCRGRAIVLSPGTGHYHALPPPALDLLADLRQSPAGISVAMARAMHPGVDVTGLVAFKLVDHVPACGIKPRARVVMEVWARNLRWRLRGGRGSWRALHRRLESGNRASADRQPRSLDLLELQAAARQALCLPLSSAKCTYVALSLCDAMRARGLDAVILLSATPGTRDFHAQARVGDVIVEPSDAIFDGFSFEPL